MKAEEKCREGGYGRKPLSSFEWSCLRCERFILRSKTLENAGNARLLFVIPCRAVHSTEEADRA